MQTTVITARTANGYRCLFLWVKRELHLNAGMHHKLTTMCYLTVWSVADDSYLKVKKTLS